MTQSDNPLLTPCQTPFEIPPFEAIKPEHFMPAFEQALAHAREEVHRIAHSDELPTFANTIEALEYAGMKLNEIAEIFFNLNSAETNDQIQQLAQQISPMLAEYANDVLLDEQLFQRIKTVYLTTTPHTLTEEQQMLLKKTYRAFTRNGALLSDADKAELRDIDRQLAILTQKFAQNVLADTNAFQLWLDESDLDGLPEYVREAAKEAAAQKGQPDKYLITLQADSYIPFMTYSNRRDLREQLYRAYGARAYQTSNDNTEIVFKIAHLRKERARLLGFPSHAHYVLEERMAASPERVMDFLHFLKEKVREGALRDHQKLSERARREGLDTLNRWDVHWLMEKIKKDEIGIDDELLKPYFPLSQVVEKGIFELAARLYGLAFIKRDDLPKYHPDVQTYEVKDHDGQTLAVFMADYFPREGKRAGAWMTQYRGQYRLNGRDVRPIVSIVCNFSKPTATRPSLLTFQEVLTLFHEFGHALHGMLADTTYPSLSGTNVYWDFVELPSQILENWCYTPEMLALMARHYQSSEPLPTDFTARLRRMKSFMEGYSTYRQLSFAYLDMGWHYQLDAPPSDLKSFENQLIKDLDLLPAVEGTAISTAFSHIFHGGYAAGYYSYKWAEVLDADAFESFEQNGLFHRPTARKFRRLLSAGGTVDPMKLFIDFKGREPDPSALLRRAGLL
ncbi:M3 family metallopeptidase [Schleiferia thermophila]|uniref:Peptidyl-dipeptidase Dcp n=1 Tax=Schleiferia thermophila TaxID=884107 RepID=A0A369ABK4_9FLAO|nr:M3 family metallopeptidase [Schleiferia thermophila]RCX05467.1 peptidyl-dipeptidase Dcp [Schleiferia thermophila]GCD79031.1 peptidase M3 [Schleiferia thermophila]